ncbi:hypothetical protein PENANT_c041G06785 [Penicillium antarcticum]|uniref:Uncharacterized protein n=1 Tax=Penicillium antarcticum TaxID=416450 RepID=A0A1V6PSC9_9EURO|nr:uncharacterized protein N7508_004703 [Penicillium antarcticum]KAJ5305688.1 hypothetical protein N7508_004703 [Penicillium antarcticum]OQD79930.1 hypothetical protein PENANT_c041G06785 [Penicillium antarcticum]
MRSIADFFNKPAFSRANNASTPETKGSDELAPESSPLTEPSSSMISNLSPESEQEAEAQLNRALYLSAQESFSQPAPWPSFQSTESAPVSSLNESFGGSQRIVKDGKEVVISSDGEDTDSICSLDDPASLFAPISKKPETAPASGTNPGIRKIKSPKKYKHTIDSLVYATVDDNEIEANVARVKANFTQNTPDGNDGTSGVNKGLNESVLTSALGDDNDDSTGLQRLLEAVRRTEALDHDRAWRFFDGAQKLPSAPEFPQHLFTRGTYLDEFLADPEARERLLMSGDFIQMALHKGLLPDELILWTFRSIPYERRNEMSNVYYRILKGVDVGHLRSLIRPADIDDLFARLGAKSQSLDPSIVVTPIPLQEASPDSGLKDSFPLISIFKLLREITDLLAEDTQERVVLLLLRLTLDLSLTADFMISSELQWTINVVLDRDNFTDINAEDMLSRVSQTFYNTTTDVCIQSRVVHHILPTSPWFALLRCRLAVSFLLKIPNPLTEPPEDVLDLKRITVLLLRDKWFHIRLFKGKGDYDYGELIAITALLNVAIDSSVLDLRYRKNETEKEYNAAIDKLAAQIKLIFSSIEDSGASHLKRMLAKEALEALHYRIVYSVRSKPPPKKTLFKSYARERDGNIRNLFGSPSNDTGKSTEITPTELSAPVGQVLGNTEIPIRKHDQIS